jgi:ribosomal protein L29
MADEVLGENSPEVLGHCSRPDIHPCIGVSPQQDSTVRHPRRLDDASDAIADDGPATAWDYLGVLFTLFSIIGVSALYMYSSSVTAQFGLHPEGRGPNRHGGSRSPSAATIDELRHEITQLKMQQNRLKANDFVGAGGVTNPPPCCVDLREKLEMMFTKMRELNVDGLGKELGELKEAMVRMRLVVVQFSEI